MIVSTLRKLDSRGRQQLRKDCDEVFPQIIIGTGDCIKDVSGSCVVTVDNWSI